MKETVFILFLLIANMQLAISQNTSYIPLRTCNPESELDDLDALDTYFDSVRLVGMGESTHGTHEFFTMRHRFFKYLVTSHGFNTFFLEADYSNCLRADRYIKGADDDVLKVTSSLGLWPWETEEMAGLIEWMREYNIEQKGKKSPLNFIGCDMQKFNATIEEIKSLAYAYDSSLVSKLPCPVISFKEFVKFGENEAFARCGNCIGEVKSLGSKVTFNEADEYTYKTLLRHLDQIMEQKRNINFGSYRDLKMAENILYHMDNDSTLKAFFWAHNVHVSNFYKPKKKKKNSFFTAGGVLKKRLGKTYFIIGQDFGQGEFNAYKKVSDKVGEDELSGYKIISNNIGLNNRTLGYKYREAKDSILFFTPDNLKIISDQKRPVYIHEIGALYISPKKDDSPTTFYLEKKVFDAFILISSTKATKLLSD